jgi:hypothetical protein
MIQQARIPLNSDELQIVAAVQSGVMLLVLLRVVMIIPALLLVYVEVVRTVCSDLWLLKAL